MITESHGARGLGTKRPVTLFPSARDAARRDICTLTVSLQSIREILRDAIEHSV